MSDAENFLSRWARRKSEADAPSSTQPDAARQGEVTRDASRDDADPERFDPEHLDLERLDLESLPSIESITGTTDVSGFLRSGVAPELTRSALRRAWASDPAIRDFIGIAESQWDFNDPNAIPGFGLLDGTEDMPALLAQALGEVEKIAEAVSAPVAAHPDGLLPAEPEAEVSPPADAGTGTASEEVAVRTSVATLGQTVQADRRRHGGALPR